MTLDQIKEKYPITKKRWETQDDRSCTEIEYCMDWITIPIIGVEDDTYVAYHDPQWLLQDHAKVWKGMLIKDTLKITSVGPPSNTIEPTTNFTGLVNIQAPKTELFALGGLALLAASCQNHNEPSFTNSSFIPSWGLSEPGYRNLDYLKLVT